MLYFQLVAMTSFHAGKCCHLVSAHNPASGLQYYNERVCLTLFVDVMTAVQRAFVTRRWPAVLHTFSVVMI